VRVIERWRDGGAQRICCSCGAREPGERPPGWLIEPVCGSAALRQAIVGERPICPACQERERSRTTQSITLTTIGSRGVELDVSPAALEEARGGVTLWSRFMVSTPLEQRRAYTLTAAEARSLAAAIEAAIAA
jgi:hypothetical protein